MRAVVVFVALAGCLSTTSTVTRATEPVPVTVAIDGSCAEALRTYPDATRCASETHVTALGITLTVVAALALILPLASFALAAPNPK